jgi:ribosomal protein L40E
MFICQKCDVEYTDDFSFCPKCGTKLSEIKEEIVDEISEDLPLLCPHCGATAPAGSVFCQKCGKEIAIPINMIHRFDTIVFENSNTTPNDKSNIEKKKLSFKIIILGAALIGSMIFVPIIISLSNQESVKTSNANYNDITYTTTPYTTTTAAPDYHEYINGIKYLSEFRLNNYDWDYSYNIYSLEFTDEGDNMFDSSSYYLDYAISGVVNGNTFLSIVVQCYDSEGYFIYETSIFHSVTDGGVCINNCVNANNPLRK